MKASAKPVWMAHFSRAFPHIQTEFDGFIQYIQSINGKLINIIISFQGQSNDYCLLLTLKGSYLR